MARHGLTPRESAEIWDGLAEIRERNGDKPGAERARKTAELIRDCERERSRREIRAKLRLA